MNAAPPTWPNDVEELVQLSDADLRTVLAALDSGPLIGIIAEGSDAFRHRVFGQLTEESVKWIKDNLFSSVGSGILTVVFGIIAFFAFRGLLDFAFHNPARNWRAVPTNIRLMMTQAYPADSYERVWISVAIIAILAGLLLVGGSLWFMISMLRAPEVDEHIPPST